MLRTIFLAICLMACLVGEESSAGKFDASEISTLTPGAALGEMAEAFDLRASAKLIEPTEHFDYVWVLSFAGENDGDAAAIAIGRHRVANTFTFGSTLAQPVGLASDLEALWKNVTLGDAIISGAELHAFPQLENVAPEQAIDALHALIRQVVWQKMLARAPTLFQEDGGISWLESKALRRMLSDSLGSDEAMENALTVTAGVSLAFLFSHVSRLDERRAFWRNMMHFEQLVPGLEPHSTFWKMREFFEAYEQGFRTPLTIAEAHRLSGKYPQCVVGSNVAQQACENMIGSQIMNYGVFENPPPGAQSIAKGSEANFVMSGYIEGMLASPNKPMAYRMCDLVAITQVLGCRERHVLAEIEGPPRFGTMCTQDAGAYVPMAFDPIVRTSTGATGGGFQIYIAASNAGDRACNDASDPKRR